MLYKRKRVYILTCYLLLFYFFFFFFYDAFRQWPNASTTVSVQTKRRASADVASTRVACVTRAAWTRCAGRYCTGLSARALTVMWATPRARRVACRTWPAYARAPRTTHAGLACRPPWTCRPSAPGTPTARRPWRAPPTAHAGTRATRSPANRPRRAWCADTGPGARANTGSPSPSWVS